MAVPVLVITERGVPVTQTERAPPCTIAANGKGIPVVVVARGGVPVNINNLP